MIIKKEVKTFIEKFMCDTCNVEMQLAGLGYMTNPMQYPYFCPNCKVTETELKHYPVVSYEEAHD
jgi:rubrerythrin